MDPSKELVTHAIVEGNTTIKSRKQLSQIIDTTLLKVTSKPKLHIISRQYANYLLKSDVVKLYIIGGPEVMNYTLTWGLHIAWNVSFEEK